MEKLCFATPAAFDAAAGFGCATLSPIQNGAVCERAAYPHALDMECLTGGYEALLAAARETVTRRGQPFATVVVFGNAGGENDFLRRLQGVLHCPMVGGGAAFDAQHGPALVPGGSQAALALIYDARYTYRVQTKCIHETLVDACRLELADARTLLRINGADAAQYLHEKKQALGLAETDFEHLTLTDALGVNAHLSLDGGVVKSGRDLAPEMTLRYVAPDAAFDAIRAFYDDPDAIVFGCAGLGGLLDRPLNAPSLGLFLFGEVCTVGDTAEFGNLMLSKLQIFPA